jgi:hypothetical protein
MTTKIELQVHCVPNSDFDAVLNGLMKLGYRLLPATPDDTYGIKYRIKHLMTTFRHLYVYPDFKLFYIHNLPDDHYGGENPEEFFGRHVIRFY